MKISRLITVIVGIILVFSVQVDDSLAQVATSFEGQIAYTGTDGNIWIMREDTGNRIQVTRDAHESLRYSGAQFSPDGRYLVYCRIVEGTEYKSSVHLANTIDLQTFELSAITTCGYAWSPDSKQLLFSQPVMIMAPADDIPDGIWVFDISTGDVSRLIPSIDLPLFNPQWSPDGSRISYHDFCFECVGQFTTWDVNSGERTEWSQPDSDWYVGADISWSPDGQYLAFDKVLPIYVGPDSTHGLHIASADGNERKEIFVSSGKSAAYPLWSTDGQTIAFGLISAYIEDHTQYHQVDLMLVNPDGSNPQLAYSADGNVFPAAWSPDGQYLLFFDKFHWESNGKLMLLDAADMSISTLLETHPYSGADWGVIPALPEQTTPELIPGTEAGDDGLLYVANDYSLMFYNFENSQSVPLSAPYTGTEFWASPDQSKILFGGNLILFDVAADGSISITRQQLPVVPSRDVSWSPDGARFAYRDHQNTLIYDLDGTSRQLSHGYDLPLWSFDGSWLAHCDTQGILWLSPAEGEPVSLAEPAVCAFAWSPNQNLLAFTEGIGYETDTHRSNLYNPESGEIRFLHEGSVHDWSANGRLLAIERLDMLGASAYSYTNFIVNPSTGKALQLGEHHTWDLGITHWSPQEQDYVYDGYRFTAELDSAQHLAGIVFDASVNGRRVLMGRENASEYDVICRDDQANEEIVLTTTRALEGPGYMMPGLWAWFSPDGEWITINDYEEYGSHSWLARCNQSSMIPLPGEFAFWDRFFTPDSRWFVIEQATQPNDTQNQIYIRNLDSGSVITLTTSGNSDTQWIEMPLRPPTYTVSGMISDEGGSPLGEVIVSISDSFSALTDENGNYVISGLPAGTYTVMPVSEDYEFSPSLLSVVVPPNNQALDFQASAHAEEVFSLPQILVPKDQATKTISNSYISVLLAICGGAGLAVGLIFILAKRRQSKSTLKTRARLPQPESPPIQKLSAEQTEEMLMEGIAQIKAGELHPGSAKLRQVIQGDPDNGEAWLWLGWAASEQKEIRTAERCFLQAENLGHPQAAKALEWLQKQEKGDS